MQTVALGHVVQRKEDGVLFKVVELELGFFEITQATATRIVVQNETEGPLVMGVRRFWREFEVHGPFFGHPCDPLPDVELRSPTWARRVY